MKIAQINHKFKDLSIKIFIYFSLCFFDCGYGMRTEVNSVPLPIYMDEMLNAGRKVYDKQSTPTNKHGYPTSVNISMYIEGIGSFRAQTMDFQLDVYLQQYWRDSRLAHNESTRILLRDREFLKKIWHPDVYFANARIAQFHEVTQANFVVWIEQDGSIIYDTRVSMTVICAMQLQNYPLDSQWCELRILSYAYDVHQLTIAWIDDSPITKNPNITMSDMHIVKLVPGLCDGNYSTGLWSCVTAEFFVSREITHHILQTYVPTTLIVIISWFSFWLDVEAVPARVSLAITTLLTLSTQANAVRNSLPEVSYMKSLDLFLAVSVLFVFGVLIEFTIINYTQRNVSVSEDEEECSETSQATSAGGTSENGLSAGVNPFAWPSLRLDDFGLVEMRDLGKAHDATIPEPSKTSGVLRYAHSVTANLMRWARNGTTAARPLSLANAKASKIGPQNGTKCTVEHNSNGGQIAITIPSPTSSFDDTDSYSYITRTLPTYDTTVVNESHKLQNRGREDSAEDDTSGTNGNHNSSYQAKTVVPTAATGTLARTLPDFAAGERLANWTQPSLDAATGSLPAYTATVTLTPRECASADAAATAEMSAKRKVTSQAKWQMAVRQIQWNKRANGRFQAKRIDAWSRWFFPLSYLTFHISYWTYYLFFA